MATATKQSRFSKGGDSAVEADEAARAAAGGGSFRKTHYLPNIGKGNFIVLRYLLDSSDWFFVDSHPGAPTKPQPSEWPKDRKYPDSMPAVCRYDKAFRADPEQGLPAVYTDCYICDAKLVNKWGRECKPVVRVYTLAILREAVVGTQEMAAAGQIAPEMVGKTVGYRDATREVEVPKKDDKGETVKDGEGKTVMETIVEPAIIVVNQPVSNYFGGLQSLYGIFGTVCDRDYIVKQNNEGKDVDYQHVGLDPIPTLKPGEPAWERYEKAIEAQGDSVDIEAILMDRSSDDFFASFFDPSKPFPKREKKDGETKGGSAPASQGAPTAQQEAAPSNDAPTDSDALAAMRARVRGTTPTAAPTAAQTPETPAPAQEEPVTAGASASPGGAPLDFS